MLVIMNFQYNFLYYMICQQNNRNPKKIYFSAEQLELIIDQYLGLSPYTQVLLKNLPLKPRKNYSLTQITNVVNSANFFSMIPGYVSSLLSTVNINIILEVLKYVSDQGVKMIPYKIKDVRLIKIVITVLTIYQRQNNKDGLPNSLALINKLIQNTGIVISPQQFKKIQKQQPLKSKVLLGIQEQLKQRFKLLKIQDKQQIQKKQKLISIDKLVPLLFKSFDISHIRKGLMLKIQEKQEGNSTHMMKEVFGVKKKASLNKIKHMNSMDLMLKYQPHLDKDYKQLMTNQFQNLPISLKRQRELEKKPKKVKKDSYEKMMLNGQLIRDQIQSELLSGEAFLTNFDGSQIVERNKKQRCNTLQLRVYQEDFKRKNHKNRTVMSTMYQKPFDKQNLQAYNKLKRLNQLN